MILSLTVAAAAALRGAPLRRLSRRTAPILASAGYDSPSPRKQLQELAPTLYAELNAAAFDSVLPADIPVTWNGRLRRTAGRCVFFSGSPRDAADRRAAIELSPHVLSDPERLRSTLAHEMCHAAHWLVDGVARPPHGEAFRKWARAVKARVPDLTITTRHTYEVPCRFRYECTGCGQPYGRHSHLDLERRRCGRCGSTLRLLEGAHGQSMPPPGSPAAAVSSSLAAAAAASTASATLRSKAPPRRRGRPREATTTSTRVKPAQLEPVLPLPAFAAFVKAEYAGLRQRWPRASHQRLMQTLGNKWRRLPKAAKRSHQAEQAAGGGNRRKAQRQPKAHRQQAKPRR